jgi:hypothetical protein
VIRPYAPSDRPALLALHAAHGADHWFADPDLQPQVDALVVEADNHLVASLTGRATVEAFLMIDPKHGTPRERWDIVADLVEQGGALARQYGFFETHLFTNDPRFARRLAGLPAVYPDGRLHLWMNLCQRFGD